MWSCISCTEGMLPPSGLWAALYTVHCTCIKPISLNFKTQTPDIYLFVYLTGTMHNTYNQCTNQKKLKVNFHVLSLGSGKVQVEVITVLSSPHMYIKSKYSTALQSQKSNIAINQINNPKTPFIKSLTNSHTLTQHNFSGNALKHTHVTFTSQNVFIWDVWGVVWRDVGVPYHTARCTKHWFWSYVFSGEKTEATFVSESPMCDSICNNVRWLNSISPINDNCWKFCLTRK